MVAEIAAEIALERELAIWADAFAFDRENGEDGPEVIEPGSPSCEQAGHSNKPDDGTKSASA
jgi:hypothetical protein